MPDGKSVWAATSDNKLEQYCCSTGMLLTMVNAGHRDEILTLAMHPSGRFLFTGAYDKLFKVWDISRCTFSFHAKRPAMD
jgi:WD40 repeat protein